MYLFIMEMMTSLCTGGLRGNEVCLQEDGEDALLVRQAKQEKNNNYYIHAGRSNSCLI